MTGASGVLGEPFCRRLEQEGCRIATLGRPGPGRTPSLAGDLAAPGTLKLEGRFDVLLHLAPLWLLPDNLPAFAAAGVRRVVALGSTSAQTKRSSSDRSDRAIASSLGQAEDRCRELAGDLELDLTLLRPTMIYGFGRDRNVTAIASLIHRIGFFPVAGAAKGLRQPVHALDVVEAGVRCTDNASTFARTYDLGGGERLSYRHMVERIFRAMGLKPRIVGLPVALYRALIAVALRAGLVGGLSPAAAERMNEDLCFDNDPAARDFGYRPAGFLEHPRRDLPPPRSR